MTAETLVWSRKAFQKSCSNASCPWKQSLWDTQNRKKESTLIKFTLATKTSSNNEQHNLTVFANDMSVHTDTNTRSPLQHTQTSPQLMHCFHRKVKVIRRKLLNGFCKQYTIWEITTEVQSMHWKSHCACQSLNTACPLLVKEYWRQ